MEWKKSLTKEAKEDKEKLGGKLLGMAQSQKGLTKDMAIDRYDGVLEFM